MKSPANQGTGFLNICVYLRSSVVPIVFEITRMKSNAKQLLGFDISVYLRSSVVAFVFLR
jgi:hypothetical protein